MNEPRSSLAAWASPSIEPPNAKALAAAALRNQRILLINLAWPMSQQDREMLEAIGGRVLLGKGR